MSVNTWKLDMGKDAGKSIELLTVQELRALSPETEICSINGERRKVHEEGESPPDDDTRFGYSAWGLAPLFFILLLCSCGPLIDVKHGIVSTGFLSDTDAFSGSIKNKDGSATWSVVNHKGTGVANTGIMAWGAAKAIQGTVDTARSANATTVKTGAQGVQNNAINHTTTLTGADGSQSIATPAIPK